MDNDHISLYERTRILPAKIGIQVRGAVYPKTTLVFIFMFDPIFKNFKMSRLALKNKLDLNVDSINGRI